MGDLLDDRVYFAGIVSSQKCNCTRSCIMLWQDIPKNRTVWKWAWEIPGNKMRRKINLDSFWDWWRYFSIPSFWWIPLPFSHCWQEMDGTPAHHHHAEQSPQQHTEGKTPSCFLVEIRDFPRRRWTDLATSTDLLSVSQRTVGIVLFLNWWVAPRLNGSWQENLAETSNCPFTTGTRQKRDSVTAKPAFKDVNRRLIRLSKKRDQYLPSKLWLPAKNTNEETGNFCCCNMSTIHLKFIWKGENKPILE